jgi:Astacin (Peptidase family M12A)
MPLYACLARHPTQKIFRASLTAKTGVHTMRAAFLNHVEWPQRAELRICFLKDKFNHEGELIDPLYSAEKAKFVEDVVTKNLAPLVNLSFVWNVPQAESNVRISFVPAMGAFSFLGIQCRNIAIEQPTMNLGWIDNDTDYDFPEARGTGIVVLHEFGHCLGLIHEHMRATSETSLQWNKPKVMRDLGGPPNNWSAQDCEEQIFKAYAIDSYNGSVYDRNSVMHYVFPADYFDPPALIDRVTQLSGLDKKTLRQKYPPVLVAAQVEPTVGNTTHFLTTGKIVVFLLVVAAVIAWAVLSRRRRHTARL